MIKTAAPISAIPTSHYCTAKTSAECRHYQLHNPDSNLDHDDSDNAAIEMPQSYTLLPAWNVHYSMWYDQNGRQRRKPLRLPNISFHSFATYIGELDLSLMPDCEDGRIYTDFTTLRKSLDSVGEIPNKETYIATEANKLVGFVSCEKHTITTMPLLSAEADRATYEIEWIWVHKKYRYQGIGSNLLEFAAKDLRARRMAAYALCQLNILSDDASCRVSRSFFEMHGFYPINSKRPCILVATLNSEAEPAFDANRNFLLGKSR
jgi:ribosomal protein S18 acetylase RimI-like enzyme